MLLTIRVHFVNLFPAARALLISIIIVSSGLRAFLSFQLGAKIQCDRSDYGKRSGALNVRLGIQRRSALGQSKSYHGQTEN